MPTHTWYWYILSISSRHDRLSIYIHDICYIYRWRHPVVPGTWYSYSAAVVQLPSVVPSTESQRLRKETRGTTMGVSSRFERPNQQSNTEWLESRAPLPCTLFPISPPESLVQPPLPEDARTVSLFGTKCLLRGYRYYYRYRLGTAML